MNRVSVINRLSASGGPFAGNKAALEAMSDGGLEELEKTYPENKATDTPATPASPASPNPPVVPATPVNTPPSTPVNNPTPAGTEGSVATETVSISRDDYAKIVAAANAYQAQQDARKASLVTSLSAAQAEFTSADLQAMEMATLEKMGKALKVEQPAQAQPVYAGLPIPTLNTKPALRELPDPLGLKVHGLRPDGKLIEKTN